MNNFKKEYLSEIKAILPIKSKRERIYLKKLSSDIEALIQEEHISSKKMLYDIYGIPSEVVHNYLSSLGIEYIVKRIKVSSHIKLAIFITRQPLKIQFLFLNIILNSKSEKTYRNITFYIIIHIVFT